MLEIWSAPCTASESTRLLLPRFIFTRVKSDPKWIIAAKSWQELTNPYLPPFTVFKTRFVGNYLFSTIQFLSQTLNAASLSLLPWKIFGRASFLSSGLHSSCHINRDDLNIPTSSFINATSSNF